jgi:hypothetical protein
MMDPKSVQVGQCYVSATGRVRRVLAIHGERVLYETRVQANQKGFTWRPSIVDPKTFAAIVERPVPCDWTPETDE